MNDYQLEPFHKRLALLMNEIHNLCVANNIAYTMLGGTLIGALRHRGFIPWDDDIDIGMTYDNYKKFVEVAFSLNHEWLEFDLAGKTIFYYPFIKAYDNRTTFLEDMRKDAKGIFVDIFPISYAGNTFEDAYKEFRKHRYYQSILKRKSYRFATGYMKEFLLHMIAKLYSVPYLMKVITSHYEELNLSKKCFSSDMDGTKKGIVPSDIFDSYKMYEFEGYEFMGVVDADRYMRLVFGDYMKLPPIDQRVPHHIDYLNLELPYKDYNSQKE